MADSQRDKSLVGSNPYGTIHYEILHQGETIGLTALIMQMDKIKPRIPTLIIMVSPRPLMSLLTRPRVPGGHGALLPHIRWVAGDGHLVNLGLKQEMRFF